MNHPLAPLLRCAAAGLLLACGVADARTEYDGVTRVVAEAVDGALERRVDDPDQVATIVQEINAVRRKSWSSYQGRLGSCAVRIVLSGANGRVGVLVLQGDELIEFGASRTSGYKRTLGSFEAPVTRRLAARIRKPGDCKG